MIFNNYPLISRTQMSRCNLAMFKDLSLSELQYKTGGKSINLL